MAWYKRSNLVLDTFHKLAKQVGKTPVEAPRVLVDEFNSGWLFRRSLHSCRFGDPKRVLKSSPKRELFENIATEASVEESTLSKGQVFSLCLFAATAIGLGSMVEQTPYTTRGHFVLVPRFLEKELVHAKFYSLKEEFKDYILSPQHPYTTKVKSIAMNIVQSPIPNHQPLRPRSLASNRKEYLDLEVVVINHPIVKACCYGGKILVFTGLLHRLESDDEIATVIAHEVAHDSARHYGVLLSKTPWLTFRKLFLDSTAKDLATGDEISVQPFFGYELEWEAGHIGLFAMASAGYNPSIAVDVYNKLNDDMVGSCCCSISTAESKTSALISQHQVMQEAMDLYHNNLDPSQSKVKG